MKFYYINNGYIKSNKLNDALILVVYCFLKRNCIIFIMFNLGFKCFIYIDFIHIKAAIVSLS